MDASFVFADLPKNILSTGDLFLNGDAGIFGLDDSEIVFMHFKKRRDGCRSAVAFLWGPWKTAQPILWDGNKAPVEAHANSVARVQVVEPSPVHTPVGIAPIDTGAAAQPAPSDEPVVWGEMWSIILAFGLLED